MVLTAGRRGALVFAGLLLVAFCLHAALYAPTDSDLGQAPLSQAASPSLDRIALAAPNTAAVITPSAPNAWGGARTGT